MRPSDEQLRLDFDSHSEEKIAKKYDVTRQTVRQWRKFLGIERRPKWYIHLDVIGKMSDQDAAKKLGTSANNIAVYRHRHQISAFRESPEALLQESFVREIGQCDQYVTTPYGTIDALSQTTIYECKSVLTTSQAHQACGQLIFYRFSYPGRELAIVCKKVDTNQKVLSAITSLGIKVIVHNAP